MYDILDPFLHKLIRTRSPVQLRKAFLKRYGKEFPADCERNGLLNAKLISRLQHNQPEDALINYYLSAIAKKHNIDWEVPVRLLRC